MALSVMSPFGFPRILGTNMNKYMRNASFLIFVVMSGFLLSGVFAGANHTNWQWDDRYTSLLWCAVTSHSDCIISITSRPPRHSDIIDIDIHNKDGIAIYQWKGHPFTVFEINNNVLYYANYNYTASGGEIVAIDLSSGKEIWRHRIKGLGPIAHSVYSSRIILNVEKDEVVIYGSESYGRYIERIDRANGQIVNTEIIDSAGATTQGQ